MKTTAEANLEQLQMATNSIPAILANNLCIQILAFQNSLSNKEDGAIATLKEINVLCKLINCLDKLKKYISLPMAIQSITGFMHYVGEKDKKLSSSLSFHLDNYLTREGNKAFKPHELEYDAPPVANTIIEKEEAIDNPSPQTEKKTTEPPNINTQAQHNSKPPNSFSHSGLNKLATSFINRQPHFAATG